MTSRDDEHKRAVRSRGARGPRVLPPTPWAEHLRKLDLHVVLYDGLDDGLIGGVLHEDGRYSAVYSRKACLDTLRRQGMSPEDAVFHLDTVLPTADPRAYPLMRACVYIRYVSCECLNFYTSPT